uniref:60S ribosomal protein L31 n=1 Tax=Rhizophora mucronata TaxID=61149 RepID=A0A2P2LJI2_RHIMU
MAVWITVCFVDELVTCMNEELVLLLYHIEIGRQKILLKLFLFIGKPVSVNNTNILTRFGGFPLPFLWLGAMCTSNCCLWLY